MSALVLRKISRGSAVTKTCDEPGCNLRGRFLVEMLGYRVPSENPVTHLPEQAQVCAKHGREAEEIWNGALGDVDGEERLAA